MPASEVMRYCHGKGLDGSLRCESGTTEKTVVMHEGHVLQAFSNDPREYLGQFLINFGHINEEQLTQAFETQQETNVFLGRILVMIGLVDEKTLRDVLTVKLRETVLSMMGWDKGRFHFNHGEVPEEKPTIDVRVRTADLLEEAEFRQTAWTSIRQVFPHDRLLLEVSASDVPKEPEHPLDTKIIDLAIEGQSIEEIGLSLHATPFSLYQRLLAMHRRSLIAPLEYEEADEEDLLLEDVADETDTEEVVIEIEPDEAHQDGEATEVSKLVAASRKMLSKNRFVEAEDLASKALEMDPHDAAVQTALKEAETGLLAELRHRLLARPVVPKISASPEDLKKRRQDPTERYLLKRFDGSKTLSTILKVSPVKEIDALKLVRTLTAQGVIRLEEPDE